MIFNRDEKVWSGEVRDVCVQVRLGPCVAPVPVASMSQIVVTARNLNTNAIIGARNNQDVFNANGGVYALDADGIPLFTFTLAATDTTLAGNALTTDRETHVFEFTFTTTAGKKGVWSLTVECLALPATALNVAADLGYARQRFRILANETNSLVPDDDWIDLLIQDGLTATNAGLRYSFDDLTITLVAGTAEYALPDNYVGSLWHSWNDVEQYEAEQDQMRRRAFWWRTQPEGPPERYALWKQRIIMVPTPDAASVAVDPSYLIRAYTTPPSFRLNGFSQLPQELWEIPLLYAAAQWLGGPMNRKQDSAKYFMDMFTLRLKAAQERYADRKVV